MCDERVLKALRENYKYKSSLELCGNILLRDVFSLNTGFNIGNEGVMKLSEVLKSNSTLTSLDLRCNTLFASFHFLTQ
jgi:hypothetical protein